MPYNTTAIARRRTNGHDLRRVKVNGHPPQFEERRRAPRTDAAALPPFTAHLVDGPVVHVVNVSRTGLLARSEARLMPGAAIGLRFVTADSVFTVVGKVVRSSLVGVDEDTPVYESALAFTTDFPLLDEEVAAGESTDASADSHADVRPGTRGVYPREIGRLNGKPTVLTVTAFSDDPSDTIRRALDIDEDPKPRH